MGKDKAWQAELQLESGFSGFEVSLLFLVFLNILMHNEGHQRLSSADIRAGPVIAPRWAHLQRQGFFLVVWPLHITEGTGMEIQWQVDTKSVCMSACVCDCVCGRYCFQRWLWEVTTLTWELEIVWSPQSCLDPRHFISAYLSRQAMGVGLRFVVSVGFTHFTQ